MCRDSRPTNVGGGHFTTKDIIRGAAHAIGHAQGNAYPPLPYTSTRDVNFIHSCLHLSGSNLARQAHLLSSIPSKHTVIHFVVWYQTHVRLSHKHPPTQYTLL